MKQNIFAVAVMGLLFSMSAQAEGNYGGVMYGEVSIDDQDSSFEVESGNLGFLLGGTNDNGLGFEVFYAITISEDDLKVGDQDVGDASMDTFGAYIIYKTPGDVYFKAKGGFAYVDLEFSFDDSGTADDSTSGLSYGAAVGMNFDKNAVELSYLVLPEFDDFEGLNLDADVDFFSLTYIRNF